MTPIPFITIIITPSPHHPQYHHHHYLTPHTTQHQTHHYSPPNMSSQPSITFITITLPLPHHLSPPQHHHYPSSTPAPLTGHGHGGGAPHDLFHRRVEGAALHPDGASPAHRAAVHLLAHPGRGHPAARPVLGHHRPAVLDDLACGWKEGLKSGWVVLQCVSYHYY